MNPTPLSGGPVDPGYQGTLTEESPDLRAVVCEAVGAERECSYDMILLEIQGSVFPFSVEPDESGVARAIVFEEDPSRLMRDAIVRSRHWWKQFRELALACIVHNLDRAI